MENMYKCENKINPPRLEDVRIGGWAGRLADNFFEKRIFSDEARDVIFREAEDAFRRQEDDATVVGYWQGEFWGKLTISAARVCRYTGNAELRAFLAGAAKTLLSFQRGDGYIGTYRNADNMISPDPARTAKVVGWPCDWNWNVWCRKYTLWGLMECYELLGDEAILTGCRRLADHLIGQLKRLGITLSDTGTFNGLPSGSIIKPMLMLYRHTGEARYLDLCLETAENWDRADGRAPNLIANALGGRPVRDWYPNGHWAKAYEMMSCLDGLIELYRVTGTRKYFDCARAMFDNLSANELNALFSVGFNDQFDHAARELNAITEPCDVIHWMRLCYELFTLTGEARYMDAFELAFLNPFLAGVFRDGRWGARGVRSSGKHLFARQPGVLHNHCCVDNMPRGFMNMAQAAVMRGDGALYVNLFTEFDATVRYDGGQDVVAIRGSYTRDGRARITVDHQSRQPGLLRVRVPAYSVRTVLRVGGAALEPEPGRYAELPLAPNSVNVIEAAFDARPVVRPFPHPVAKRSDEDWKVQRWCSPSKDPFSARSAMTPDRMIWTPRCTLMMGPVLLARSKRIGSSEEEMFASPSLFGRDVSCRLTEAGGEGQCEFIAEFCTPEGVLTTRVCDFASASNELLDDPAYFSVWF